MITSKQLLRIQQLGEEMAVKRAELFERPDLETSLLSILYTNQFNAHIAGLITELTTAFEYRTESVKEAQSLSGFETTVKCCDVEHKYCSSDRYKGDLNAYSKSLLSLYVNKE